MLKSCTPRKFMSPIKASLLGVKVRPVSSGQRTSNWGQTPIMDLYKCAQFGREQERLQSS